MNLDLNQLSSEDIINGLSNNKIREILLSLGPRLRGDALGRIDDVVICPTGHFLLSGHKRPREEEEPEPEPEPTVEESEYEFIDDTESKSPLDHCFSYQRAMEQGGYTHIRESWRQQFIVAVDYVRTHGLTDINIPDMTTHTYDGLTRDVGSWIKHQRVLHRSGNLSEHRTSVLKDCGINWYKKQEHWDMMFDLYQRYKQNHGDEEPSTTYTCDSGENLGEWVAIQRKEYLKGTLSQDHLNKLESQGFVWKPRSNAWNENYQKLVTFLRNNHNVLPVRNKTGTREEYGLDLAMWLCKQKDKVVKGRLTMDQDRKLRALPETARVYLNLFDA
ncbi:hypothetical protein DSLPV1_219 [Dishui lake phycodnavirus 1]|uniref:hypothetical protein n=1 Tax=Dishui lake phycodnavirus 1 TaxID=2079134 RepID=UPI000CD6C096|nr:hypothetical protein C5Y57_gp179 [Dishui lake phycodnavirus 1]AUT19190.1 hypothetical protein DSLPV1_219 [Dishui lake phycodnavirus 1]